MLEILNKIRRRLVSKLILTVGLFFLVSVATWAYFNVSYQKEKVMQNIVSSTDRLTATIRLGTHYAMMLNSRDDINQIIKNIGRLPELKNIRIYNKAGEIKFSNRPSEIDLATNIKAEACDICHRSDPPYSELALRERTRIFDDPAGYRLLGIISPIRNEPGCSIDCHVHPEGKKILGALDLVVSLEQTDREIRQCIGEPVNPSKDLESINDDRSHVSPEDKSILIIEDDPKFAKILRDLSREKGFKVVVAGDGETGLHFADYYMPSAIILDIGLPGMDG